MALPRLFVDAFLFNLHVDEVRPASPGTSFRPRHISDDRESLQYLRPTLFVCCSQFLNSSIVPYLFMNEHFSKKYKFHPHIRRFTNLFLQHSASTLQFVSSFDTEFFFRDVAMNVALPQFNEFVSQKSSYFARSLTSLTVSHFRFHFQLLLRRFSLNSDTSPSLVKSQMNFSEQLIPLLLRSYFNNHRSKRSR